MSISKAVLLLALVAAPALASDREQTRERFGLFNNCAPFELLVEHLPPDADKINLNHDALVATAESRLRAARVYTSGASSRRAPFLYVNVNVVARSAAVSVEYVKRMLDCLSLIDDFAVTWERSVLVSGASRSNVMSAASELLDRFLVEYLRVNEEACNARFAPGAS